jgi:hypothetical protein
VALFLDATRFYFGVFITFLNFRCCLVENHYCTCSFLTLPLSGLSKGTFACFRELLPHLVLHSLSPMISKWSAFLGAILFRLELGITGFFRLAATLCFGSLYIGHIVKAFLTWDLEGLAGLVG